MPNVQYIRNYDPREGTSVITFDDGRPNLEIGSGESIHVSDEEFATLSQRVELKVVEEATLAGPEDEGDGLDDLNNEELRQIAKDEDIDITGLRKNDDIVERIRESRAPSDEEGVESLPATATSGVGSATPAGGGAVGSAAGAGPEGAGGGAPGGTSGNDPGAGS